MKQRPWARLVVAIGAGIALALSAPTLAAIGQFSPPVGLSSPPHPVVLGGICVSLTEAFSSITDATAQSLIESSLIAAGCETSTSTTTTQTTTPSSTTTTIGCLPEPTIAPSTTTPPTLPPPPPTTAPPTIPPRPMPTTVP